MSSFFTEVTVIYVVAVDHVVLSRLRYNFNIYFFIRSTDKRNDNNKSSHEHTQTGGIFLGNKLMYKPH